MGAVAGAKMATGICHFSGVGEPGEIAGLVTLRQAAPDAVLEITGQVTGLPEGEHGLQIREFADFQQGAGTTGAIFNPDGKPHGGPADTERMVGDLGNVEADAEGKAVIQITDRYATLFGERSIIGRALVIYENADDLGQAEDDERTKVDGNVGDGIAWATIGLAQS